MSCKPFDAYIMKYMDGEINDLERTQLMRHISECSMCNLEFQQLTSIMGVLNEQSNIEPPDDFEAAVMHKVNLLDIYNKKQKEKKLMLLYFISSMTLTFLVLALGVIFKRHVLDFMLSIGVPADAAYGVYGVLARVDSFIKIAAVVITYINKTFADFYYLLVGLFAIVFMSKLYEYSAVQRFNNKESVVIKNK